MSTERTLHDPTIERDACGIGFVADASGRASRSVLDRVLAGLAGVSHRGATRRGRQDRRRRRRPPSPSPQRSSPTPAAASPWCSSVSVDLRGRPRGIEEACRAEGIEPAGWREVPVEPDALGETALASMPRIEQLVLERPAGDDDAVELAAYRARRRADLVPGAYVASLSFRTVTYKALCAAEQLARFYPDLRDPAIEVPFGIFHQRFSTNTTPTWERAQPFRTLCHNGEINAIAGNVNWMRARRGRLDDAVLGQAIDETGSDSAILDNALELLVARRPRRPPRADDADPAGLAERPRARPARCATSSVTTPGSSSRGTDRRRSCSPTAASSAPRSTATACARFAGRRPRTAWSSARPRRARSRCRRAPARAAASSGRAR